MRYVMEMIISTSHNRFSYAFAYTNKVVIGNTFIQPEYLSIYWHMLGS